MAGLEEERALELSEALARPAWPHLRRVEAALVAHVRHTLGAARFDQAFSAGSRLTQRDAIAIVRDRRRTSTHTS